MSQAAVIGELIVSIALGADIGAAARLTVGDAAKDAGIVEELEVVLASDTVVSGIAGCAAVNTASDAAAVGKRETWIALTAHSGIGARGAAGQSAGKHTLSSHCVQSAIGAGITEIGLCARCASWNAALNASSISSIHESEAGVAS